MTGLRALTQMGFDEDRQVAELNQRIRRVLWVFRTVATHMAALPAQLVVRGPEARLAPKEAEMMSLVIHELATNAVKFGALSQPQAKIRIVWDITYSICVRVLRFEWLEAGVEVAGAPSAPGFGSELIERLIARELRGEGKMIFLPDGVHCTIEIPLSGPQDRHG